MSTGARSVSRQQSLEQAATRSVEPLDVLDREHDRSGHGQRLEHGARGGLDAGPELGGRQRRPAGLPAQREQLRQGRQRVRSVVAEQAHETGPQPRAHGEVGVVLAHLEPAAQDIDERPVGDFDAMGDARARDVGDAFSGSRPQLLEQPGLADPVRAGEHQNPPAPRDQVVEHLVQPRELALAAHEWCLEPGASSPLLPNESKRLDGLLATLDRQLAHRLEREAAREPPSRQGADENRAGLGGRLQPRGDVRRVAQSHLLRSGGAYRSDGSRAGVHADPDGEAADAERGLHLAPVLGDRTEDLQCGPGGAVRIVLVRDRHAEVGADPVAHVGLDRPAVLLDHRCHTGHAFPDDRLDLLGGEALAEPGRADDIGEEARDRP